MYVMATLGCATVSSESVVRHAQAELERHRVSTARFDGGPVGEDRSGSGRASFCGGAASGINATCTESASAAASSGDSGVATAMRRMITVP